MSVFPWATFFYGTMIFTDESWMTSWLINHGQKKRTTWFWKIHDNARSILVFKSLPFADLRTSYDVTMSLILFSAAFNLELISDKLCESLCRTLEYIL